MLAGTTVDKMVDPQVGIIFGYGWAADVGDFLRDQPDAVLTRDEGDLQEWTLPGKPTFCDFPVSVHFSFSLDTLVTVEIRLLVDDFDSADVESLAQAVSAWFNEDFSSPEEGLLLVEEETTRVTLDLLDKRIVFEDMEL